MDAGQRWLLTNILGKPLRTWDERNHEFQYFYDTAHRPTLSKVIGGDRKKADGSDDRLDNIFERVIYGESLLTGIRTDINRFNEATLQGRNILGQVIQHFDTGGLLDTPNYDFKGQPLATTRKLSINYKDVADWTDFDLANLVNVLELGIGFTFTTLTDALGRITQQTAPDGSIITPSYNEAGLLNGETVLHIGEAISSAYIKDIDYNEKGQQEKIIYGNDVSTKFYYDKETFRLKRLESKRLNNEVLQNLFYTFDSVGNITTIEDKAIPISFFANLMIEPISEYTYDALYRLAEATGRENNEALNFSDCDNWNDKPFMHSMNPGNAMAVRNYTQRYKYDAIGNIMEMKHLAGIRNWTRGYEYETANNRLKRTFIGDNGSPANYTKYQHHAKHGYLEELPHLEKISWNFKEEVVLTTKQHCTDDNIPVITYYQYDGTGQRIRKITENQAAAGGIATKKEERIYIAGYELYKKYDGTGLERVSLSLLDKGNRFVMVETRNDVDDGTEKKLVRYQLHNHLSSAALELDGSAAARLISYEEYHPFGTTAYQANNATIKSATKRYRYTGMERDEENGLEYHSARYYVPWLGRWINADPSGLIDGVNIFSYSHNNPVRLKDQTGTQATIGSDYRFRMNPELLAFSQAFTAGGYPPPGFTSTTVTDPSGNTTLRTSPNSVTPDPNANTTSGSGNLDAPSFLFTSIGQPWKATPAGNTTLEFTATGSGSVGWNGNNVSSSGGLTGWLGAVRHGFSWGDIGPVAGISATTGTGGSSTGGFIGGTAHFRQKISHDAGLGIYIAPLVTFGGATPAAGGSGTVALGNEPDTGSGWDFNVSGSYASTGQFLYPASPVFSNLWSVTALGSTSSTSQGTDADSSSSSSHEVYVSGSGGGAISQPDGSPPISGNALQVGYGYNRQWNWGQGTNQTNGFGIYAGITYEHSWLRPDPVAPATTASVIEGNTIMLRFNITTGANTR